MNEVTGYNVMMVMNNAVKYIYFLKQNYIYIYLYMQFVK